MSIRVERLVKSYGGHPVVNDVSLDVATGEFFVLLGPSGSGKSTVLRMIAGLAPADSGRILLHGRDVSGEPPQRRGVGFVFQHYALFRNMSVAENVEFALRVRRVPAAERRRRREELLEIVGLAGHGKRLPQQLSGGQQQRVALARALAHQPEVLLLDEPFGALDARIRVDLRRAVRAIHRELRVTTIFVTHDQEEAFELADRVGVMSVGRLLETGSPTCLYLEPKTEFVATFLGTANLMVGESSAGEVRLGPVRFPKPNPGPDAPADPLPQRVQVLFRPEDVSMRASAGELEWPALGEAVVEETGFVGSFERIRLRIPRIPGVRPISPPAPFGGDTFVVEAVRSQHQTRRYPLAVGDRAWVGVRRVHALAHPGLSFLLLSDGTAAAAAALDLGAQIARLAHARVTLLVGAADEERARRDAAAARERVGSGLASLETRAIAGDLLEAAAYEASERSPDLIVRGLPPHGRTESVESLLRAADSNVLLVPEASPVPSRVLICATVGEPGKDDVQFTARLVRHLGATANVLTVLPDAHTAEEEAHAERFLAACARSMALLGVPANTMMRAGSPWAVIRGEVAAANNDLLVVGAPMAERPGTLGGVVASLLNGRLPCPLLVVRSTRREGEAK